MSSNCKASSPEQSIQIPLQTRTILACAALVLAGMGCRKSEARAFQQSFRSGCVETGDWIISDSRAPGSFGDNHGTFSPDSLSCTNGALRLALDQDNTQTGITSRGAELRTRGSFGYGRYAFVMRAASTSPTPDGPGQPASGSVSAVFSYTNHSQTEIDVEVLGSESHAVHLTTWANPDPTRPPHESDKSVIDVPDTAAAFHTYSYLWKPGRIDWFLDGNKVWTTTTKVPTQPAPIVINLWGSNHFWGGSASPGVKRYMYVREVSFTPLADTN